VTRYSARHYQAVGGGADTPEAVRERTRHRAICEQAHRECMERYPVLTAQNAGEAIAWQEARIAELTHAR